MKERSLSVPVPAVVRIGESLVSGLNYVEAVTTAAHIGPSVRIVDCTLREGEQAADVNFTVEDKVVIAKALHRIGVQEIEVGFGDRDNVAIRAIRDAGVTTDLSALVVGWVDNWEESARHAVKAGVDRVNLILGCSDIRLEKVLGWSRADLLTRAVTAVHCIKDMGVKVKFCPSDTSRQEVGFVCELFAAAEEAGADVAVMADTFGVLGPAAMAYFVRMLKKASAMPLELHTHQDVGLGLANILRGLEEGAEGAHVSVLGIADRAGNTPLEELAVALHLFYKVDTGIDLAQLTSLARLVAERAQFTIPDQKALVGRNAFAQKLDGHVAGFLAEPTAYESINASLTGADRRIALGNYSGPVAIREKLRQQRLELDEGSIDHLVSLVRRTALTKKRSLTDQEFIDLVTPLTRTARHSSG